MLYKPEHLRGTSEYLTYIVNIKASLFRSLKKHWQIRSKLNFYMLFKNATCTIVRYDKRSWRRRWALDPDSENLSVKPSEQSGNKQATKIQHKFPIKVSTDFMQCRVNKNNNYSGSKEKEAWNKTSAAEETQKEEDSKRSLAGISGKGERGTCVLHYDWLLLHWRAQEWSFEAKWDEQ
jgi:hypothetical protein